MNHLNITVIGRVQGVWFRAKTKECADQYGITGFVKNKINGTVYIEAEGSNESLSSFLNWCKKGPKLANVEHLETSTGEIQHYSNFEIRR